MIILRKHTVIATERLYTDVTRTKVLKEGEKGVAFLLAAKGNEIPYKLADRLGLLNDADKESPPQSVETIEARKTRVPKELKQRS